MKNKKYFSYLLSLALFVFLQVFNVDAFDERNEESSVVESSLEWEKIKFSKKKLRFEALLPNLGKKTTQGDLVTFLGKGLKEETYLIICNPTEVDYNLDVIEGVLEEVKETFTESVVTMFEVSDGKIKYMIEAKPNDGTGNARFLFTENYMIVMATEDENEDNQAYFFNSLVIY